MNRGDVYWVDFDPAIGGEIQKTRPAVIVTSDRAGRHLNRLQVVPLTSNASRVFPGEALVHLNGQLEKALATQLQTASRLRFKQYIGKLTPQDVSAIESAIRVLLEL